MEGEKRWSLKGMTALVTGGTRGIGHAIVEELARFEVVVHTCSRNQNELDECLQDWKTKGFKVTGSICDVMHEDQREKLMKTASSIFYGKLNILVNNAGTAKSKEILNQKAEDISIIMSTNFESCFHLCQLAYPLMKASKGGSIVNISSISSVLVTSPGVIYGASKGVLNEMTKGLACEWAKDGIRVNAVLPGVIQTSIYGPIALEKMVQDPKDVPIYLTNLIERTPLQRMGKPEEISSMVVYLCFPSASFITGQAIIVDGGLTINALS